MMELIPLSNASSSYWKAYISPKLINQAACLLFLIKYVLELELDIVKLPVSQPD